MQEVLKELEHMFVIIIRQEDYYNKNNKYKNKL